jgi:hypothetical protein
MKLVICLLFAALFALVAVSADEPDIDESVDPFDFEEELEKRGRFVLFDIDVLRLFFNF